MAYVSDILQEKGSEVITIAPDKSVSEAARMLARARIGAVLVTTGGTLVGILSERDIAYAFADQGDSLRAQTVSSLMKSKPQTCSPDDTVNKCLSEMTKKRIRHLPVMREGKLSGMVSIGDLVKSRLEEAIAEADELRNFIQS